MLTVLPPDEALRAITEAFPPRPAAETVPLDDALGRVLFAAVTAEEFVPGFDRSTVDGYALRASDTFGCSDALPAVLRAQGAIRMGEAAPAALEPGCCMAIPTGGALPAGADACAMLEYAEVYGDGTVGISKPVAPGENLIFRGDDTRPGRTVLPAGRRLTPQDIGALAAMGRTEAPVCKKPLVGLISTGDELVDASEPPGPGQVRDVNAPLLRALFRSAGAETRFYGILKDDAALLGATLDEAVADCDAVCISGGSSVGQADATCRVVADRGTLLFHGVAMKPGKPTICGSVEGKAVFGLPGHPAAAAIAAQLFVLPHLSRLTGHTDPCRPVPARLADPVSANHGRAQYMAVTLEKRGGALWARPVRSKSGLITALAGADGWFCIPRDREGVPAGETVDVYLY